MQQVEKPFVTDAYVYTIYNQRSTPLNPQQYATVPAAMAVLSELQNKIPEAGPFQLVSESSGNFSNRVLHGTGGPDKDLPLAQLSIRRYNSDVLHNVGVLYFALSNGYTFPLDEFKVEAGIF